MFLVKNNLLLRLVVAIILLTHSIPGMLDGGINAFGKLYLDQVGFAPVGLALAWAIKISHVLAAIALIANRFVLVACLGTILILVAGIFMVHLPDGWFVVGGGRNGVEYNVLLVAVLVFLGVGRLRLTVL